MRGRRLYDAGPASGQQWLNVSRLPEQITHLIRSNELHYKIVLRRFEKLRPKGSCSITKQLYRLRWNLKTA